MRCANEFIECATIVQSKGTHVVILNNNMATTTTGTDTQFNYLSCSNGNWGYYDGSAKAVPLPYMPLPLNLRPTAPLTYDVILKIADGTAGLELIGLEVSQGYEDSVNIANKASGLHLLGDFGLGEGQGLRCITIKGGVRSVIISGRIMNRGSNCDIRIGDWIDQTTVPCHDIHLVGMSHIDGKRIRVIRNFRDEAFLSPNCKLLLWQSLGLTAYWYFKYVVRAIMRIPVGQSGPTWLS
jgi:hypothetical protein